MVKDHILCLEILMWLLQLHFKQMLIIPVPLFCNGNGDGMERSLKGIL